MGNLSCFSFDLSHVMFFAVLIRLISAYSILAWRKESRICFLSSDSFWASYRFSMKPMPIAWLTADRNGAITVATCFSLVKKRAKNEKPKNPQDSIQSFLDHGTEKSTSSGFQLWLAYFVKNVPDWFFEITSATSNPVSNPVWRSPNNSADSPFESSASTRHKLLWKRTKTKPALCPRGPSFFCEVIFGLAFKNWHFVVHTDFSDPATMNLHCLPILRINRGGTSQKNTWISSEENQWSSRKPCCPLVVPHELCHTMTMKRATVCQLCNTDESAADRNYPKGWLSCYRECTIRQSRWSRGDRRRSVHPRLACSSRGSCTWRVRRWRSRSPRAPLHQPRKQPRHLSVHIDLDGEETNFCNRTALKLVDNCFQIWLEMGVKQKKSLWPLRPKVSSPLKLGVSWL